MVNGLYHRKNSNSGHSITFEKVGTLLSPPAKEDLEREGEREREEYIERRVGRERERERERVKKVHAISEIDDRSLTRIT